MSSEDLEVDEYCLLHLYGDCKLHRSNNRLHRYTLLELQASATEKSHFEKIKLLCSQLLLDNEHKIGCRSVVFPVCAYACYKTAKSTNEWKLCEKYYLQSIGLNNIYIYWY